MFHKHEEAATILLTTASGYSPSTTETIVSSTANRRTAFVIEASKFILNY